MSCQETIPFRPDATARPVAASRAPRRVVIGAIEALLARWVDAESRRRTARGMLELPDDLLRDIGVSRGDLHLEARRMLRR